MVARRAYTIGVWLLLASILVQFLLAGLGIFTSPLFFYWHASVNGAIVGLLPLVLVAVGWLGRVPRRTLWLTAGRYGTRGPAITAALPLSHGRRGLAPRRIGTPCSQCTADLLGRYEVAGPDSGAQ
jgi:hypothetical protein